MSIEYMVNFKKKVSNLESFLKFIGKEPIIYTSRNTGRPGYGIYICVYNVKGNTLEKRYDGEVHPDDIKSLKNAQYLNVFYPDSRFFKDEKQCIYVDGDNAYSIEIKSKYKTSTKDNIEIQFEITNWNPIKKMEKAPFFLQNKSDLETILLHHFPNVRKSGKNNIHPGILLLAPQLIPLVENDYKVCESTLTQIYSYWDIEGIRKAKEVFGFEYHEFVFKSTNISAFNRMTNRNGNSLKECFKVPEEMFEIIKNETDIVQLDNLRKMCHTGIIEYTDIKYMLSYYLYNLNNISYILKFRYNKKPIFTPKTLEEYIDYVNIFEAIEPVNAILQISQFLIGCEKNHIKPEFNGTILMNLRYMSIIEEMIESDLYEKVSIAGEEEPNRMYDYYDDVNENYFIRGICNLEDIFNESYSLHPFVNKIANENGNLYLLRKLSDPDKSILAFEIVDKVPVEIHRAKDCVIDTELSAFIERWKEFIKIV